MKRLVVVLAIVIAICAMSVSAVAELGGFIESPSANGAPTLVPEDSDASVNVVAYRDRVDTLTEGELTSFENAYKSIVASTDVASMNSKLPRIASRLKVYADKLAISDIFFITVDGDLEDGIASITSETLDKFVSLLYFNGSNWVVVDTDIKDGNIIEFTAVPGAYAVVVSTDATPDYGESGCKISPISIIIIIIVAAALVTTYILIRKAKRKYEK